jgi:predicted permease
VANRGAGRGDEGEREAKKGPPRLGELLLAALLPTSEAQEVLGGLRERWGELARDEDERVADRWYRRQVAGFFARAWTIRRSGGFGDERAKVGDTMGRFESLMGDVRWAIRSLRRRRTFTVVALLTLGLGIGVNSAVFTLVEAHFLAPLPYDTPEEVVLLWEAERGSTDVTTVSPGNYHTWKRDAGAFRGVAAYNVDQATLSGDGVAEGVVASVVTPGFFDVLGVRPVLGSRFDERAATEAAGRVVILGHGLWIRRYGSDPTIVGRDIRIDGAAHTVVGVLPPSFRQPEKSLSWQSAELWRPLLIEEQREDFDSRYLRVVARLAPEVSLERAREEMTSMAAAMAAAYPEQNGGHEIQVWAVDDYLVGASRPVLLLLLAASTAVLLIVCSNVANLTMARGQDRRGEFAVRAALGSGGHRIARQVIVESVVLALGGALIGAFGLVLGREALQTLQERFFSSLVPIDVGAEVLVATTLVAILSGVLAGIPLARTAYGTELRAALGEGGARSGRGPGGTQDALVVGQVALATSLVVVALLLSRSFSAIVSVPPGFASDGLVTFEVTAPTARYADRDAVERYLRDVWGAVEELPGVRAVSMVSDLPFTTENRWTVLAVDGLPFDRENPPRAELKSISPEYFDVMEIPVMRGALPADTWQAIDDERPVVVNERLASLFWPGQDPIGRAFAETYDDGPRYRVAAIVGDVLDDGFEGRPDPLFYLNWGAQPRRRMSFVLAVEGGGAEVAPAIRRALSTVDPDIPAAGLRTLDELLGETVVRPKAASLISGILALVALLVSAAGVYGVLANMVQGRTMEIGIRCALGAPRSEITGIVLRHTTRLLALGLVIGVSGAILTARALSAVLFDVAPWDPVTLVGSATLLVSVGLIAAWLPVRRALGVDPIETLRP